MVPRCEKSIGASGRARTYVMKVQSGLPGFGTYGKSTALRGAGAFGIVAVRRSANEADVGTYFIITERRERSKSKHGETVNAELQSTVGSPRAEWICSFNLRLQRLCGWGDVFATPKALATAVKHRNEEELVAIVPGCAALIDRGETHQIPRVEEAIRCGLPALTDCKHTFFTEETPLSEKCGGTLHNRNVKTNQRRRPVHVGPRHAAPAVVPRGAPPARMRLRMMRLRVGRSTWICCGHATTARARMTGRRSPHHLPVCTAAPKSPIQTTASDAASST